MAIKITDECINRGPCEPECPNKENPHKEDEFFYIVTDKRTECNGFYDETQCVAVYPVDCCIIDDEKNEKKEDLINKRYSLHKE